MRHKACLEYITPPLWPDWTIQTQLRIQKLVQPPISKMEKNQNLIFIPQNNIHSTCQIFKNGQKWLPVGSFFRQFLNLGHWNEIFFKTSNYLKKFEMYWFHCLFIQSILAHMKIYIIIRTNKFFVFVQELLFHILEIFVTTMYIFSINLISYKICNVNMYVSILTEHMNMQWYQLISIYFENILGLTRIWFKCPKFKQLLKNKSFVNHFFSFLKISHVWMHVIFYGDFFFEFTVADLNGPYLHKASCWISTLIVVYE